MKSFIDNDQINDDDVSCYCNFNNVETDIEQTLKEEYDRGLQDIENFEEISNLCESSDDELEIDDFKNAKEKIEDFNKSLYPNENIENNQLINFIMLAIRFNKVATTNVCDFQQFKEIINSNLIDQLYEEKFKFTLDLQKFNNICYEINLILLKYNYFLRIFEVKDKYGHLSMKEPKKQNIVREISSCLIEKCNGFQVISIEFDRKQKKNLSPLISFKSLSKNQILNLLVIIQMILQKPTQIFTQLKIKQNVLSVVTNVTIAGIFFKTRDT